MKRQKANFEIIQILSQYLMDNPDIRFGQALINLDFLVQVPDSFPPKYFSPFHEEPVQLLHRITPQKATDGLSSKGE